MTRTRHAAALLVLLLALLAAIPAAAQPSAAAASAKASRAIPPPPLVAQVDDVVRAAFAANGPGGTVLVVRNGDVLYRKAYGMANLELGVPLQPDMVFRLGSITKQFTASAIMLLVQDGKLSLDDPIEKFLPGYPTQGHVITIEHLLTHTSGIQSYTDIPGWMASRVVNDMTVQELVDGFKKEPMQFAPGERYSYNNSAYVLLGAIIEKVSGQSYEAFLQARIFDPLGMTSTFYGSNGPIIPRRVEGYTDDNGTTRNARYLSMTQPYSAGSLVSSVDDLARWDASLYDGRLLTPASLKRMWTPYTLRNGKSTRYGYGWAISTLRGRPSIEHGGGIPGFSTYALRLPDEHVFVAVLCNSDSPKTGPGYLAKRLAAIAVGDPFPTRVAVKLDPSVLARHAGVYQVDKHTQRTVTVEGGRLYTQRSGGPRLEAIPTSETDFYYEGSLTTVRFERDPSGRTVAMVLSPEEGAESERAVRVSDAAATRVEVKVDPAIYDAYVGQYELGPGFVLTVTREGDHLMTQATGQSKVEIFPSSETEFFLKVVDAQITFVRGPDGTVNQLVLHQGGRDMPAPRKN